MSHLLNLPKPEVKGIGHVQYRCADCGDLMEPDEAVIHDGRSYHRTHDSEARAPETTEDTGHGG